MNNYYNMYGNNRYAQPMQQIPQPSPPQPAQEMTNCDFIKVSGPKQVADYIVNGGWTVYFLDNNKPIMYVKKAREFGPTTVRYYKIEEIDSAELERMINDDPITGNHERVQQPNQDILVSREEFDLMKQELQDYKSNLSKIINTLNNNCSDIRILQDMFSKNNMRDRRDSYESSNRQPDKPNAGDDKSYPKRSKSDGSSQTNG